MTALLVKAVYDADGNVVALGEIAIDEVAQLPGPLAFPDGTIQTTASTGNGGGSGVVSSPTPPDAPKEGQTWFETDSGRSYIWYVNPDTQVGCWIAVSQVDAVGGPQGEPGPQGPKGDQGIQGDAGPQGIGLRYVGRVATVSALPASATHGDVYIADDTGNAHVWNSTTSVWDDAGKITGATGPQGPQGDAGPAGADSQVPGPQGPAGADGAVGPQGPQGEVGPTGPQGAGGAAGWNSIGSIIKCTMLVPGAGAITRGTVYPLGSGHWQLNDVTAAPANSNNGYAQALDAVPTEAVTGQWAWYSSGYNISSTLSSFVTTVTCYGEAIKVAD